MTEANQNANSFNSELNPEFSETNNNNRENQREEASMAADSFTSNSNKSLRDSTPEPLASPSCDSTTAEHKMNWQKVAHKLREYNRKLLKKEFRLEQQLADIDNKFTKCIEKSRNSDVLVAQQEQDIRQYQEKIALFNSQQADLQAIVDRKEAAIAELSQQHELSQQLAARLERECTLLQEKYNNRVYELTAKDKEIKELQNKLDRQQRSALQYKAELYRYQEQVGSSASTIPPKEPVIPKRQSYSPQRTITPWSISAVSEPKITIPKSKSPSISPKKTTRSQTIETAAQIATRSASQAKQKETSQTNQTTVKPQSSVKVKPQSLAAVDLPTFPRQM